MTDALKLREHRSPEGKRELLARILRLKARQQTARVPLSHGQRALWFLHRSDPESAAYHVAFAVRIHSALDVDALRRASQALLERHEMLRAVFKTDAAGPFQEIAGYREICFQITDARTADTTELDAQVRRAYARPFDLEHGPLFRVDLFICSGAEHVLLVTVHHIVYDAWSLWITLDELGKLYEAHVKGRRSALPPLPVRYRDWVEQQRERLDGPAGEKLWRFWQQELFGELQALDLPVVQPRSAVRAARGATHRFVLERPLSERLKRLAQAQGVTPFMLFLAAFQVLLYRYSGQDTILVGSPTAGRGDPQFAGVIGYFVNPVVLRADLADNPSFLAFLRSVRDTVLRVLDHDAYPFPLLVERLNPRRAAHHSPIFQAAFVMQRTQRPGEIFDLLLAAAGEPGVCRWGGLELGYFDLPQQEGQFGLELEMIEAAGLWLASFKYSTDLFDASLIERMSGHLRVLLESIAEDPAQEVQRLALLSNQERHQLMRTRLCQAPEPAPRDCLHSRFEQCVAEHSQRNALSCAGESITYGELNARANRLAHRLRALGVGPEVRVGLFMERSLDMVVGVLAILKAGGSYVPLDPTSPAERLTFILQDSAVKVLVTEQALAEKLPPASHSVLRMDADAAQIAGESALDPGVPASPEQLAYVIYTSGSTGTPKGVQITHANVMRLFDSTHGEFRFDECDVWTLFHSIAFDFSVWELWGALLYGGRLVVVPYWISRDPGEFLRLLARERVTVLNQTPSAFRQLMDAESRAPGCSSPLALRWVIFGGEALDPPSLRSWFQRHGDALPQLVNMYGITETTVHVTLRRLQLADSEDPRSLIGQPISDLEIHLLDAQLQPVPLGIAGEIYVAGAGLARGYLNRPELDRERFIEHAVDGKTPLRLYRSGDLARRLPGGDLEYLGRGDQQVKIRGFRIELGEIEAVLREHPQVRGAVVALRRDPHGERYLLAYVVSAGPSEVPASSLREHLRRRLPNYMVPSTFVPIASIPLTNNGKVDHGTLKSLDIGSAPASATFLLPRDPLERTLADLWQRVLGVSTLGVRDDFFDLGGHSMLAVSLMAEIEREFAQTLPPSLLFQHSTIESLAPVLRGRVSLPPPTSLVAIRPQGALTPFFCAAGGGGSVLYLYALSRQLAEQRPFYGLQAVGLDGDREPLHRVEEMAERYLSEVRRVQPQGPYLLGGHCFGGWVAFEMAQQLTRAGERVDLVALIDVPAPRESVPSAAAPPDDPLWIERIAKAMGEAVQCDLGVTAERLRDLDPDDRLELLRQRMEQVGLVPPGCGIAQVRGLVRVFTANSCARYLPRAPLPVPLALFRARAHHPDYDYSGAEDPGVAPGRSTLGWAGLGSTTPSVDLVDGTHITMMSEPSVRDLAARLQARLREASPGIFAPGGKITAN